MRTVTQSYGLSPDHSLSLPLSPSSSLHVPLPLFLRDRAIGWDRPATNDRIERKSTDNVGTIPAPAIVHLRNRWRTSATRRDPLGVTSTRDPEPLLLRITVLRSVRIGGGGFCIFYECSNE